MQGISAFLDKFRRLEHPDRKKELISQFILNETGLSLKKEEMNLRGRTLFLKSDPYIKSELYLRKDALLKKISESVTDFQLDDIR